MKIRRSITLSVMAAIVAVMVCGTAGCRAQPSPRATSPQSRPQILAASAAFHVATLPLNAQVVAAGDNVFWRLPSEPPRSGHVVAGAVSRINLCTGRTTVDAWLTALFARRRIDQWALAGRRVAWIDTSVRRAVAGGTTLIGTRICVANRGLLTPRRLTRLEWGAASDTGDYGPAMSGLVFDGRQAAWHDARSVLAGQGLPLRGRDAGIFSCGVGGGSPQRVGSGSGPDDGMLAVSGARVFSVEPCGVGGADQALAWWDAVSRLRSVAAAAPAIDGFAAGARVVVWKQRAAGAPELTPDSVCASYLGAHRVVKLSGFAAGEVPPVVSGDLAIWVERRPERAGAIDVVGGRLAHNQRQFVIALTATRGQAPDLLVAGDRWLVWTIRDKRTELYAARLVRDAEGVRVKPPGGG